MKEVINDRIQEPRVYAVLFRNEGTDKIFLHLSLAYSLDDVCRVVANQSLANEQWLPIMWQSFSINDLIRVSRGNIQVEKIPEQTIASNPEQIKNELMSKIIATKDTNLFKNNKEMFTPSEQKYIKDKLKDIKEDGK